MLLCVCKYQVTKSDEEVRKRKMRRSKGLIFKVKNCDSSFKSANKLKNSSSDLFFLTRKSEEFFTPKDTFSQQLLMEIIPWIKHHIILCIFCLPLLFSITIWISRCQTSEDHQKIELQKRMKKQKIGLKSCLYHLLIYRKTCHSTTCQGNNLISFFSSALFLFWLEEEKMKGWSNI